MRTKNRKAPPIISTVALIKTRLDHWRQELSVPGMGAIIRCLSGHAVINVSMTDWTIGPDDAIIIFPDDVVMLRSSDNEFMAEALMFAPEVLREASFQLEHTVYSLLRSDRCRTDSDVVREIHKRLFSMLKVYFEQNDCNCLDRLVTLMLKAFFIGFYDYICRYPNKVNAGNVTNARELLFNRFMDMVTQHYREMREVRQYADALCITPKYLNTVVRQKTGQTAKSIIDHYVVLQLKQRLSAGTESSKQLAWEFHFSDDSFFCRYFKAHTGMTPQQFRRKPI